MHIRRNRSSSDEKLLVFFLFVFVFLIIMAMLMGHNAEKEIRDAPLPAINIELERACLEAMRVAQVSEFAARRECVERLRSK